MNPSNECHLGSSGATEVCHPGRIAARVYEYDEEAFCIHTKKGEDSNFDESLQTLWTTAMEEGYFRYKLDSLDTKVLPGSFGFVAQLNTKRAKQRRSPQAINDIVQAFDPNVFNFTKVAKEEILLHFQPSHWKSDDICGKEPPVNYLIINASPLEFCNCLLVPNIFRHCNQVLTFDGLRLAVETMFLSRNPALRAGFNSLGACASVNHLHFHLYYLRHTLYLETAPVRQLAGNCYVIQDFLSEGFAFQLLTTDVVTIVKSVMKLVTYLLERGISHNVFITRGAAFSDGTESDTRYEAIRIYVWARKFMSGAKNDFSFNPALCELAGHLLVKREEDFKTITEKYASDMLRQVCHDDFTKVYDDVRRLFL